jgi:transcriptional repressor NrdR
MRCPYCKVDDDRVLETRPMEGGLAVRRRRQCKRCRRRFTTYERVEHRPILVIKKSGKRQPFDRQKLSMALEKACAKRPIPEDRISAVLDRIEARIYEKYDKEVPAKEIGDLVMLELRDLDQVAYVRFASVYREFQDVSEFLKELGPMLGKLKLKR